MQVGSKNMEESKLEQTSTTDIRSYGWDEANRSIRYLEEATEHLSGSGS